VFLDLKSLLVVMFMNRELLTNDDSISSQNQQFPIRFFYETISESNKHSIFWHDDLKIIKVLLGKATYVINGFTYKVEEGDVIIINPRQIYQVWSNTKRTFRTKVIQLNYNFIKPQAADLMTKNIVNPLSTSRQIFHNVIRSPELLVRFEYLENEIDKKPYLFEMNSKVLVMNIIMFLLRNGLYYINKAYNQRRNESLSIVRKAIEFLQDNHHINITLDDVSNECKISKFHLCHIFKENTHLTIKQYLTNFRLKESTRLLKETRMNINSISDAVGFNSPSYFIKKFKEEFNISPNQYRKL